MPVPAQNTNLATILLALRTLLLTGGNFTPACVWIGTTPMTTRPAGDHICVIQPGHQAVRQPVVTGAGNNAVWFEGSIVCTLFTRVALDRAEQQTDALTNEAIGLINDMNNVMSAFSQAIPQDTNGNYVLCEPMRLVSLDFPEPPDKVGRMKAVVRFEISWIKAIT